MSILKMDLLSRILTVVHISKPLEVWKYSMFGVMPPTEVLSWRICSKLGCMPT